MKQDETSTGITEIPDENFFELDPFEDVNFDKNEMYSYIRIEGDEMVFNDELKAALTKSFLSKINKSFIDIGEDSLQFAFEMVGYNTALLSAKVLVNGF